MTNYDVEIKHNGTEYEYKIDAYTGEILETKEEADDDYTHRAETKEQNPPIEAKLSTESGSEISLDKAKEVALSYAGVTVEQAVVRKAKLNHNDGRVEYELEFIVGNTEYEYDIDASTGEVISSSVETKNIEASQKSSGGDIGMEKARTIALNHAGVKSADADKLEEDRDHDDGGKMYDIDVKARNMEYEYKVDAYTGAILEHEAEIDD